MSHSYYRQNTVNSDNNSQDSSSSSNSVLDALLAGIGNNQKNQKSNEITIPIVTRDPEVETAKAVTTEVEPVDETPGFPDLTNARAAGESDISSDHDDTDSDIPELEDDSDTDSDIPELEDDFDSDSDDDVPALEDDETQNYINKCNFVVKVMKDGATEPETVFSESAILAEGEDAFEKLREITQNTPYGSIVSDLVGQSPVTGLLDSNEPGIDFMNEIFGLKPPSFSSPKIKNKIEDPIMSIIDKILTPPETEKIAVTNYGSMYENRLVDTIINDLVKSVSPSPPINRIRQNVETNGNNTGCKCRFCTVKRSTPMHHSRPMSYNRPMEPPAPKRYAPLPFFAMNAPKPEPKTEPKQLVKKSDPMTDILMGLTAVTLMGGLMALLCMDDKKDKEIEKKVEKQTEQIKKQTEQIEKDEESIEISTSREVEVEDEVLFTSEDYKFFKEHFRNFDGDVSELSPTFQSMYYEVQDELEDEKKEKEEYEAKQRALAAEMEKPYVAPIIGYTAEGKEIRLRQDGMLETDTSVSGAQFNQMFNNCSLVKLTNATSCHNGFQFVEGVNVDSNEFKYDEECGPDGLYFCRQKDAENWFNYGHSDMKYVWDVVIPDDARVCIYERKLKADHFILTNKRSLATLAAEKVRTMVYTDVSTSEIVSYLTRHFNHEMLNEPEVVEAMVDLIEIRPDAFAEMDDVLKTPKVRNAAAKLYDQAYLYMDQDDFEDNSEALVLQCVYTNPQIFSEIEEEHKTNAVCAAAFEGSVKNYEQIPEEHKTLDMSKTYLFANSDGTSYIPVAHKNHYEMVDAVLDCNPYDVKNIEFRNLNKDRCMKIVREDGMLISAIPFSMIDYDICLEAVKTSSYAYSAVPMQFRDQDLAATLVEFHPDCLADLPSDLITLSMIERSVMDDAAHLKKLNFDGAHSGVRDLIMDNLDILIDYEPKVVVHLPKNMVSNEYALRAIKADNKVFWYINQEFTDLDFIVEAVKNGVAFRAIPRERLTMELLKDLVRSRDGLIEEISSRFLSDALYIEAIAVHNYDHTKIEAQYMTTALSNYIAANKPESDQAYDRKAAELEFELEQSLIN
jgi:hypothetical protein